MPHCREVKPTEGRNRNEKKEQGHYIPNLFVERNKVLVSKKRDEIDDKGQCQKGTKKIVIKQKATKSLFNHINFLHFSCSL